MKVLVFNCRKVLEIICRKVLVFTCCLHLCASKYDDDKSIIILYRISAEYDLGEADAPVAFEFFKSIKYNDLIVEADNTLTADFINYEVSNDIYNQELSYGEYSTTLNISGYESEDAFYKKYIETKIAEYSIERVGETN